MIEVYNEVDGTVMSFPSANAAELYGLTGQATYSAVRLAGRADRLTPTLSQVLGGV